MARKPSYVAALGEAKKPLDKMLLAVHGNLQIEGEYEIMLAKRWRDHLAVFGWDPKQLLKD